jgi:hypothetical protein
MARYEVRLRDHAGDRHHGAAVVSAASPSEAVMLARAGFPEPAGAHLYAVYRQRRLRRRKLVGTFPLGGGDDGLAGVREPRRPLPAPPSLHAEADPPAYRDN